MNGYGGDQWGSWSRQPSMQSGTPFDEIISKYLGQNYGQGMQTMAWTGDTKRKYPNEDESWKQGLGLVGSIIGAIIGSYYGGPIGGQIGGKAGGKIGGSWGSFADTGKPEMLLQGF